ncbi:alpha/beta hydrolase [Catenuloplanes japonicus]|uniref:alpha/beta hydrolase n=1 Tax=Catenuloplanes japonicus TaxID=33876 RepID=UPI000527014A|nr:alpha/beta hydrolase [Catenuloplanes japonicus]
MTRPDVHALLGYLAGQDSIETQTPQQARDGLAASVPLADLPAPAIAVERALTIPTRSGGIPGLLLDPRTDRGPGPVLVWFHGGGFVTGGPHTHRSFAIALAHRLDLPVVLPGYRLAPEHPYPAAVEDAEDTARWAAALPGTGTLVLGGDSAGGTLAIVTAMALRGDVPVAAHLVIYPATDLTRPYPSHAEFATGRLLTEAGRRWYYTHYRPDAASWRASPLIGDLAGLPPAVILTAGEDPVRDEGRAYAAALVTAGVDTVYLEAAGVIHAFVLLRRAIPSIQADLERAFTALEQLLARS